MNKDNLKRIILDNQDRIEKPQLIKRDLLIEIVKVGCGFP